MKKRILRALIYIGILGIGTASSWAAITKSYCVDTSGTGNTDYDAIYTSLQSALTAAQTNSAPTVIDVRQGVYIDNYSYSSSEGYALTVRGGFTTGCGSRTLDPTNTILDGNNAGITLQIEDSSGGAFSVEGFTITNGDSSYGGGGLRVSSSDASSTSGGIEVTHNIITNNEAARGAGVYIASAGTTGTAAITIADNTISGNTAEYAGGGDTNGGGVFVSGSTDSGAVGTITLQDNTIGSNSSTGYGGGAYVYSSSSLGSAGNISLQGNTMTANTTTYGGGGVYARSEGETGSGDIGISDNTCNENGAGNSGGGMRIVSTTSTGSSGNITIEDNAFSDNTAGSTGGGGIYATTESVGEDSGSMIAQGNTCSGNAVDNGGGGGMELENRGGTAAGSVTVQDNTFYGNSAYAGGGVDIFSSIDSGTGTVGSVTFTDNLISGNTADLRAGANIRSRHYDTGSAAQISVANNIITGNLATGTSGSIGAIEATSRNLVSGGATGTVIFTNNTVAHNSRDVGGGNVLLSSDANDVQVYNNIVWGNTNGDLQIAAGGSAFGYNNDYSDLSGTWDASAGNIDVDPKFKQAGYWDDAGTSGDTSDDFWVEGDYHLKRNSPCINMGDNAAPGIPTEDFEGDARIQKSTVDMGADETPYWPLSRSALSHLPLLLFEEE